MDGSAARQERDRLRQRVRALEQQRAALQQRWAAAVVLDRDKQAEFAGVGHALGVRLPELRTLLLEVWLHDRAPGVACLGRRTQAAARRAGALLAVLDECAAEHVRQAVADEIYVPQPVRRVVEPESSCWVSGRRTEHVDGATRAQELGRLPHVEQVTRDAGSGLSKGVAVLNATREEQGLPAVADQLDHFHTPRVGGRGVGRAARRALTAAAAAAAAPDRRRQQGQPVTGVVNRVRVRWPQAEQAFDAWRACARAWQAVQEALAVFTPEGELNTRAQAEARSAEVLPRRPAAALATSKRLRGHAQTLTYLDELQRPRAALPLPAAVRQAAVQQEGLRRRPQLLQGAAVRAATPRGLLLVGSVILAKAGLLGQQAVHGVRSVLRSSWRASSLVECVNSVLRVPQARPRKMSQGLLDLKRL